MRALALGVALAAAALLATTAPAAEPNENPCKYDLEKLCKNVSKRGGQRIACLDQHRSELSAACQNHLSQRETRRVKKKKDKAKRKHGNPNRAWFSACNHDLQTFCREIAAGPGQLSKCLDEHQGQLSPGCKIARDGGRKAAD